MVNNLKRAMNINTRNLNMYQERLSSGRRIHRPSDDPVGVINTLRYSSTIVEAEEYLNKINEAKNFLNTTDSALGNVTDIIHRANDLTIQGINGTNSEGSREAIAKEIRELADQIAVIANTIFGSKHIFAGTNVTESPMIKDGDTWQWQGNNEEMFLEIGAGVTIPINSVMGEYFFNPDFDADTNPDNPGINQLLDDIANNLENTNDEPQEDNIAKLQKNLSGLQSILDEFVAQRAVVGARVNRLELQENRLESTRIDYTELLSKNQDADMAEVIMDLKMQENVYRASLAAGARIIMPSLVDFLR